MKINESINRRAFLRGSICALSGMILSAAIPCEAQENSAEEKSVIFKTESYPQPCSPKAWQKKGIVLEATEKWEGNGIQNFTTRAEPLENGAWRIWYSFISEKNDYGLAYAEGIPGENMKKIMAQCYNGEPADSQFSIGNLPDKWMPVQVTHILLLNGRHRLYFWAHGPEICRYLAAESDDGRKYKILNPMKPVLYHPNDRAARGAAAKEDLAATPEIISNDSTMIYQLPDGTFEMYSVALVNIPKSDPGYIEHDNAPGRLRVIDRYLSGDGIHFENRKRIIEKDSADPPDQQFYYLSVTRTAKGCVGMLGHYRCEAQTMDLEWCYSSGGEKWERPFRSPWILRDKPPAPDCLGIYAPNQLVYQNRLWHLFYTGVNHTHNSKQTYGKPRQVIMYAAADSIWNQNT